MKEARHESPRIVRFLLHELSQRGNSIETERRAVVPRAGGGGNGEPLPMGTDFLLRGDGNILKLVLVIKAQLHGFT